MCTRTQESYIGLLYDDNKNKVFKCTSQVIFESVSHYAQIGQAKSEAFSSKKMKVPGSVTLAIGENERLLALAPKNKIRLAVITASLQESGRASHKRRLQAGLRFNKGRW